MSPLVGRVAELDLLAAKLIQPDVRLLTLTGPGGVGKTRLALALLDRMSPAFDGRTAFISLAALDDPALAPAEIARALGATLSASTSPLDAIIRAHGNAPALLLIDNLEQIVAAGAFLVDLLAAAPQLTLLVTSRETLRVRPEHVELVAPLSLEPAKDGRAISEAAELFLSRSRAPDLTLDARETQLQAVEEICRRLDGLPLAIELAAGRGRALSPVDLLDRLGNRLHLLDRGPRDLPARQRTLRDTVAWSYDLLTPSECLLFHLLAVFSASSPLTALEELW
ncbi:MAG: hypothetical protein IT336_07900, partial [Thermomicrobiales bacterium]|nr:hypothetical protein [Thermomicrobiales bacterium]